MATNYYGYDNDDFFAMTDQPRKKSSPPQVRAKPLNPAVTSHSNFTLEIDRGRARLTEQGLLHATQLARLGEALSRESPAATSSLEVIYGAYVASASKLIAEYGSDLSYDNLPQRSLLQRLFNE